MITTPNMKKMAGKALLSGGLALAALGLASGTAQAFNPQPEPPGKPITASNPAPESPGAINGFNPQPDPPGKQITAFSPQPLSPGSINGFNPQPDPPGKPIAGVIRGG